MIKILVVEDNALQQTLIATKLRQDGYQVLVAENGAVALDVLDKTEVQLIVTDIMMPLLDGYELIQSLRQASYQVPIIVMTARSQLDDMEKGFELGADDYMVKPIQLQELGLRIKALLRRANIFASHQLKVGDCLLDEEQFSLSKGDTLLTLPQKEFRLLFHLLSYPNKIFTRLELLDNIWGMEDDLDERLVDACINKLRRKVEHFPDFTIETVRGVGYRVHEN
ncbi:DNA-binding response OmpR family regulator [Streptococcus gallinaceus]|uniref:response regulator transcription factor n=1 Tax=Streptococcus gallinaceus TaxID=165758 RepID=UPI0020A14310|nr:response regulator transcription factor [Streptococcus gallinaceus]MCP1638329.1 DNA-binding response OmpR family regulator [Streptococcus gallinaceus]MCP1769584.1 DNA-binding response OmpR family regulator [Streptococcus gallinaceus]